MIKNKNVLAIIILCAIIISLFLPISISLAADNKVYENLEYSESSDGTITIKRLLNRETVTELVIPEEIDGKKVTTISGQFATPAGPGEEVALKKLTIPSTVKTAGSEYYGVVENLVNLEEIIVDEDNPYLSSVDGVLYNKEKTELIAYPANKSGSTYNIPETVTIVRGLAFGFTKQLEEVNIPNTVTSLGRSCFAQSSIKRLVVPESVETIETYLCYKCPNLAYVEINSDGYIDYNAFQECQKLETVIIGDRINEIREEAFRDCTNLKSVNFEDFNVVTISSEAFINCGSLPKTIKFSDSIELLKKDAFNSDITLEMTGDDYVESTDEWNKCVKIKVNGTQDYEEAYEAFKLTNEERKAEGLTELQLDKNLMDIAMQRAYEISVYFAHRRPETYRWFNFTDPSQDTIIFIDDTLYQMGLTGKADFWAENIAGDYRSASSVIEGWMGSEGHKANILGSFSTIGIGCVQVGNKYFWIQVFGVDECTPEVTRNNITEERIIPACTAYVNDLEGYEGITLDCVKNTINAGDTAKVNVESKFAYANSTTYLEPSSFTWSSSNEEVLTVDQNGIVTGVSAGNADVIITLSDGQTRSFSFTVKSNLLKGDINKDGEVALYDAFQILRYVILDGENLSKDQIYIMDFNGDEKVSLYDAFQFLRQVILG